MQRLWHKLSYIGIDPTLPYTQNKSNIFLNRISTVILGFVLTSILINLYLKDYNFVIPLSIGALLFFITYWLNYSGKYILAKGNTIITTIGLLTFMLVKAGSGAGIEFYLLCLTLLPAIVFDDKRIIYFFQAICILCLVGQKVHEDIYEQEPISELSIYRIFYIVNSIYSGLMIILAITFFKNQNTRSEQEILEQKKLIEEKNESLEILNANLSRSNRDLEQFAYVASHDLKEPLRMISSFATLLSRKCAETDTEIHEYNRYITKGVERMQNLINDLLTYAQIGSEEKAFTWINTGKLIEEVQHYLALIIDETDAQIQCKDLPSVYGIEPQIGQLFYNLISNGIKFRRTSEIPVIQISCEEKENEWVFAVKDNGLGISEAYKDKVFVIFQRLHNAEEYPGTGIGLSLCKRIAERHGGNIWLESELGVGTTIFFNIPKP